MMQERQSSTGIALAVKQAGSQRKLAKTLGVSQQAVSLWVDQGWVPLRRVEQIEQKFSIPRVRLVNPRIIDLVTADSLPV
jgi:DNA-binding transcriptional regulator YdaS (Cro superfamily)